MDRWLASVHPVHMGKKAQKPKHFLREWRKRQGFTLERAADALATTHATLSRIERGKIPYSQGLLEALAELYGTSPASLIMRDPTDKNAIWDIWDRVPDAERPRAAQVLETFTKKTGTNN